MTKSEFIGRNIARIKFANVYANLIMNTISAISLVTIAFNFPQYLILALIPLALICIWIIGYIVDTKKIVAFDFKKTQSTQIKGYTEVWGYLTDNVFIPAFKKMLKDLEEEKKCAE